MTARTFLVLGLLLAGGCSNEGDPDGGASDAGVDASAVVDAGQGADAAIEADGGSGERDAGAADSGARDAAVSDADVSDADVSDADVSDGGPADGGPADGGPADGGPADGGPADGGPADGGPADGGPADGGPADGGPADAGATDPCTPLPSGLTTWTRTDTASTGTPDTYFFDVTPGDPFCASITGGGGGTWTLVVSNGTSSGVYCSGSPTCSIRVPPGQTTLLVTAVTTDIGGYTLTVRHLPR